MKEIKLDLLPDEHLEHKQAGDLFITHPQNINIMITAVSGDFLITNQRLIFYQEPYDGVSPGFHPDGGVNFEIKRDAIIRVHKKRFSSRLFIFTDTGAVSISVFKWKNFCTLLGHTPK